MHKLTLFALLLISPLAVADNASNYRDNFMRTCHDSSDDDQTIAMCACVFDTWLAQLPSRGDAAAVTAAKLMANVEGDYLPSQIQQAAVLMDSLQDISMQCADKVMGTIHLGGDDVDAYFDNDSGANAAPASPSDTAAPQQRGLFGAVVGWAGEQAGLPSAVNEAAADVVDDNESTIKEKFNPFKSRFNPFRSDRDE